MSTRSILARLQPEGKRYDVRYVHSDGYPEHVGATLVKHYTDPLLVDQLFALGDLSALYDNIGQPHDFDWRQQVDFQKWDEDERSNWTRAYHRDRGEKLELHTCAKSRLKTFCDQMDGEYVYVWQPVENTWKCFEVLGTKLQEISLLQFV